MDTKVTIKTVGVIGAGTMGNGIAHVFAKSGYNVVLVETQQLALERGVQAIGKNLEREVAKNKIKWCCLPTRRQFRLPRSRRRPGVRTK